MFFLSVSCFSSLPSALGLGRESFPACVVFHHKCSGAIHQGQVQDGYSLYTARINHVRLNLFYSMLETGVIIR